MVFIISHNELYSEAVLEEHVFEKFALIPDHTKLVVGSSEFRSIDKVPETLHVSCYSGFALPLFTQMIEIFNKRWQTLDLISMMQELKRTAAADYRGYPGDRMYPWDAISIKENLSTLPIFQKKEEEHSS